MARRKRTLPIGVVAERYGVSASTLRYWEQIEVLPPQARFAGSRHYDVDAIRRIKFIRMAQRAGLSLDAIRALLAGHVDRSPTFGDWSRIAEDQLGVIERRISELAQLKATIEGCLSCGCQHAQRCQLLSLLDAPLAGVAQGRR